MAIDFKWPVVDGEVPVWTGHGFTVGQRPQAVLSYGAAASGWSEELTDLHEEAAGAGTHPIDMASRRRARAALKRHIPVPPADAVILEAGCSSGFLLEELVAEWPQSLVIGSDFIEGPLRRLAGRLPALPLLRFDLVQCPLPAASVDAVVLLNVLEHIEDDRGALAQVWRILKPGGVAIIEVPAGPKLYDAYDRHLQHFRRYALGDLAALAQSCGFRVLERSHLGFFVYPGFAWVKRRNRRWLDAPDEVRERVVQENIRSTGQGGQGGLLTYAMALEEALDAWVEYPWGIRCTLTVARPA
jgi:SAM-dependent methyltransferase